MTDASRILSTFALNSAWQLVAIVGAAALGDLLLRRASAKARHGLWCTALVLSVAVPLLATIPSRPSAHRGPVALPAPPAAPAPSSAVLPGSTPSRLTIPVSAGVGVAALALALLASGARGARLLRALRAAARWRRQAVPCASARVAAVKRECEAALGLPPVPVLTLRGLDGPITLGARRPVIVLPGSFEKDHTDDALRSALGHELAHVKRRDYLANLLHELALLPFAWHPVVRPLRHRLAGTREMACDELATARVIEPRRYARSLVAVAAAGSRPSVTPALGVNDADILEERIRHLLRPRGGPGRRRRLDVTAGVALLLTTSLCASLAVVEAEPLPATAHAEWRSRMNHVVGALMMALAVSSGEDPLARGLEELRQGNLPAASASVEKAIALDPKDRDALYTLGVIRWTEVYQAVGKAKEAGGLDAAQRSALGARVASGRDALGKALAIDPDFVDALLYQSLLHRLDANLATSPEVAQKHTQQDEQLLSRAKELKAAGKGAPGSSALPPPPPPPPAKAALPPPPPPPPAGKSQ